MLKLVARKNVERCIQYFCKDRELDPVEKRGTWLGQGAAILGLTPPAGEKVSILVPVPVNEKDLRSVLRGIAPPSSPVTPRQPLNGRYVGQKKRRCAHDCVLSSHKSISVAALCLPAEHLAQAMAVRHAWARAIGDCVTFMECLARRGNGKRKDVETGNLLIAAYTHFTSRRNDPQLHSHLLVANATHDASADANRMWYALEPLSIYRQAREIDMVFQRELLRRLRELGLAAEMQQADGIKVASLPVAPVICRRLSQAYNAVVAATAGRWDRTNRTSADCRIENLINQRLRPSKSGLLASRDAMFERALSSSEIKEIVARIGEPLAPEKVPLITPAAPPSPKELDRLLLRASEQLKLRDTRPRHLSLAALSAAEVYRDVPFQPFFNHAHAHLAKLRRKAVADRLAKDYALAQHKFWHEEDWFGLNASAHHSAVPHQPAAKPIPTKPMASPPIPSVAPQPPEAMPDERRASWVITALAERKSLQEKLARDGVDETTPAIAPRQTTRQQTTHGNAKSCPQAIDPILSPTVPRLVPPTAPDVQPYLPPPEESPPSQPLSL